MSNELIGVLGLVVLLVLIGFRVWIGVALGLVGFLGIALMLDWHAALSAVVIVPFAYLDNYVTTAIPMFTVMGFIVAESNIGKNAFDCANRFLSRTTGGLASATVAAAGMVGAVTGSDNVSSVIISKLALPELKRHGCADSLATASVAAASPVAILLPPSMALLMFGMLTDTSIASLFMAGIIPGILVLIGYVIAINITCRIKPNLCPKGEKFTWKEKLQSLKGAAPILILFLLVLGSIYLGIATPTEAGAIGAFGALIIAIAGGGMTLGKVRNILLNAVLSIGFVVFLLMGTFIFIRFMALSRVPFMVSNLILGVELAPWMVMVLIGFMYLIVGAVIPQIPLQILTVPIIAPAVVAMGFDIIWFGIFVNIMMGLAAVTPPLGMNVFIVSGLSKVPVTTVYRGILPFVISDIVVIILLAIFPILALWLPRMMLA